MMIETLTAPPPNGALRGRMVGRYLVLQKLGWREGTTYEALDLEHDRKVALTLLRWERAGDLGRYRFVREAQSLAELSHFNIARVLDVGTVDEHVWLAQELVVGRTLWEWLRAPRDWRDTLEIMRAAGEGLAAVHRFGTVHGTFDPLEVKIGKDGWVCVEGLCNALFHGIPAMRASLSIKSPSYVAPELITKGQSSPASDQYAFCVTLWEALYGELPFEGTPPELLASIIAGKRRPAPAGSPVPDSVRRACERGLSVDPAQRWPSMQALLDALP